ncbi:unnamed protein product [Durusdinium trenchii]|uniref:Alpha/beta hydrolase fold-3 domain-containing protein n=1 Tax=Durusdinium trenchii TaxID=1381693 RepID=A0ABP0S601_9DINO
MLELSWCLLALQLLLFLFTLRRAARPAPPPPPPPAPVDVEAAVAEAPRAKKGKGKRQVVHIRPEDRRPPAVPPQVRPLRPRADARVDPAQLVLVAGAEAARGAARAAVLILPGGNYDNCNLRGPLEVALWLQSLGLAAYILRFRLRTEGHFWPAQLEDGLEALRLIGEEVAKRPIGVLGFSAGGHLASVLATHHPHLLAFHILIYGSTDVVSSMRDDELRPGNACLGSMAHTFGLPGH